MRIVLVGKELEVRRPNRRHRAKAMTLSQIIDASNDKFLRPMEFILASRPIDDRHNSISIQSPSLSASPVRRTKLARRVAQRRIDQMRRGRVGVTAQCQDIAQVAGQRAAVMRKVLQIFARPLPQHSLLDLFRL